MIHLLPALLIACSASAASWRAAVGTRDITPNLSEHRIYLAGYGAKGRRPTAIHDSLYARSLVISDGKATVAIVAVDSIGIFHEDVLDIRRQLNWDSKTKYLMVAATHDHAAPDTLGLWGPLPGVSGVDPKYQKHWKTAVVELVRELEGRMEPAQLAAAETKLDPSGLCFDHRDPVVIDPYLNVLSLKSAKGRALGTVVRWSCHPEALERDNYGVSADYPGALCAKVEKETGAPCVFLSGIIGGLMSPEIDRQDSVEIARAEAKRVGEAVAAAALAAAKTAEPISAERFGFKSLTLPIPIENARYTLFLRSLAFGHVLYDEGGKPLPTWKSYWLPLKHLLFYPLQDRDRPRIATEVVRLMFGSIDLLGIPGELFPELALGGYQGQYRFKHPLIRPGNARPPDLTKAPKGPYLRDKMKGKHKWLVGLANDELGYIVPEYDFIATPSRTMSPRPKGHHYEETNSVGRSATPLLIGAMEEVLK